MSARLGGQTAWGWKVAAYLFLAGVGAGAYLDAQLLDWLNEGLPLASSIGVALSWPLVAVGTLFLVWDLGMPLRFWRAGTVPSRSWISRGVIILMVFLGLAFLQSVASAWPWTILERAEGARMALAALGGLFALLTLAYTGLLLGAVRPIPFWTMPALPLLFIASGMSTGGMAIHLALPFYGTGEQAAQVASFDAWVIAIEMLVLVVYLMGTYGTTGRPSVLVLVTGPLSATFWFGLVLLGLALPLGAALVESVGGVEGAALAVIGAVPGLAGGYILRYLVIAAGVKAPLSVSSVLMPQRT
ncbi:MAG: polysulfide reductase NrfD [Chloroflexi bacterium]|nr:polysulfide reductase NrfD [Chloroflexota bacterium]